MYKIQHQARALLALALLAFGASREARAFPEMIRHGYVNCTSCHVSPTGGGVLTPYGRSLSKEVLSTWGTDNETRFLWFITPPEKVYLGGDVRVVQLYQNAPTFSQGRLIFMQGDAEGAVRLGKFLLDATFGYTDQGNPQNFGSHFLSRRHYAIWETPVEDVTLRFGKYLFQYGIMSPDHTIPTKRGIQVNDEGTETYNLELAWLNEKYNIYATGILGRPADTELDREKGFSLTGSVALEEKYKLGMSWLYGVKTQSNRHVFGPWGMWGFSPKFFLLSELDFTANASDLTPAQGRQWGLADYLRLDYEHWQGFHVFLTQGMVRPDFQNVSTLTKSYGLGIQFFPRPHFDIDAEWQIHIAQAVEGYTDYAFLMLHVYL